MDSQDHIPGPHPHRGIFVSLVFAIILLVGIFFLFVYSVFLVPEPEAPVISELEQAIEDSILEDIEEATTIKEEEVMETEMKTYSYTNPSLNFFPQFDYEEAWHVARNDTYTDSQLSSVLIINPGPIWFCAGCDGPLAPIMMSRTSINRFGVTKNAFNAYEADTITSGGTVENVQVTELENGTLHQFSGIAPEGLLAAHPYEMFIFETVENEVIQITYRNISNSADARDEIWNTVKNSLDFSNIE